MKSIITCSLILMVLIQSNSTIAADKVVVIPLGNSTANSVNKLWGTGRPGVTVGGTWNTSPANSTIEYNYSTSVATWYDADEVCPSGTWICSINDIAGILNSIPSFARMGCDGSWIIGTTLAWVSESSTEFQNAGIARVESDTADMSKCLSIKVWCCRDK